MPPKPEYVHELKAVTSVQARAIEALEKNAELAIQQDAALKSSIHELKTQIAILEQRIGDVARRMEEHDRRWWGLLMLFASALLSLASGLIVTLAKK